MSLKLQVTSLLQGTGYNMDNLKHLKFCQQPIEDLILFSKLVAKNLTCSLLLESETTCEKHGITIHTDIGLISLKIYVEGVYPQLAVNFIFIVFNLLHALYQDS